MKEFPIHTPQHLGSVLQGFRKEQGLNQTEVGAKVGLGQSVVSQLEKSPERAGWGKVFKLLSALDLEIVVRPRGSGVRKSEW